MGDLEARLGAVLTVHSVKLESGITEFGKAFMLGSAEKGRVADNSLEAVVSKAEEAFLGSQEVGQCTA